MLRGRHRSFEASRSQRAADRSQNFSGNQAAKVKARHFAALLAASKFESREDRADAQPLV
jgi:hypothetical protein